MADKVEQPPIDVEALEARMRQTVQNSVAETMQQMNRPAERPAASDPVEDVVRPIVEKLVGPAARQISLQAQQGQDAAVFYATTPGAAQYSAQIETRVRELAKRGMHVDRASVFTLLKGENLDKFVEAGIKQRDDAIKAAEEHAMVTGGRGMAPQGTPSKIWDGDVRIATPEETETSLADVAF